MKVAIFNGPDSDPTEFRFRKDTTVVEVEDFKTTLIVEAMHRVPWNMTSGQMFLATRVDEDNPEQIHLYHEFLLFMHPEDAPNPRKDDAA